MNDQTLLKLLELDKKEEEFYLTLFHKKISFFWGVMSAGIAGILVGAFKATSWEQYIFLSFGPALLLIVSILMKLSLFRSYQRFIEVIARIAKIEVLLGLHKQKIDADSPYWANETLIFKRYSDSRSQFETSEAFVNSVSLLGSFKIYSNLVKLLQILFIFLFSALIIQAWRIY